MPSTLPFTYSLVRSQRKTVSLVVSDDGSLIVKAPNRVPRFIIDSFVASKTGWIQKILNRRSSTASRFPVPILTAEDIKLVKKEFKHEMLVFLRDQAEEMDVDFNNFKLSSARTRWGSCSSRKSINLNWRLALVPEELRYYVAIHELAHLRHMNHSQAFWNFVGKFDPEYKANRVKLKQFGHFLKEL